MRVVFRVDASSTIGTGHATRCLALANGLRVAGAEVLFVSRLHEGHICEKIESSGFRVARLPTRQETGHSWNDHAHWLMTSQAVDASETAAATRSAGFDAPDWLIADHYALDRNWEAAMRASVRQIMVIDDLADRPHRCDLLLDQNLGRKAADYDGLVPGFARRMIGPSHALLRPEFAAAREGALAARACRREGLRNILITLGGVDLPNASETVLRALVALPTTGSLNVDLVLGSAAPALDRLRALAPTLPFTCTVSVDVQDMAARMARADLAIGAAGGTAWERCALGLPSLMVVLADNQAPAAKALAQSRAAILLGRADAPDLKDALWAALKRLSDPAELDAMATRAAAICDGCGVAKVVRALLTPRLRLRPATLHDAETVWHWRSESQTHSFLRHDGTATLHSHLLWFAGALAAMDQHLFIAEVPGPAGHLRLDDLGAGRARVSIVLAPQARGQGLAVPALAALGAEAATLGFAELVAEVHVENLASVRAFAAAGFTRRAGEEGFLIFERRL